VGWHASWQLDRKLKFHEKGLYKTYSGGKAAPISISFFKELPP
jgi:hypothetical protein